MNNLTKEQTRLFSIIASVVMLVAFFIPAGSFGASVSLWDLLVGSGYGKMVPIGFIGTIVLLLFLLTPIYLILYAFKDEKALEPLKPIFKVSPKIVYILPIALFLVVLVIGAMYGGVTPIWLYLLGSLAIYFIGSFAVKE